jgi:hypothetical protein
LKCLWILSRLWSRKRVLCWILRTWTWGSPLLILVRLLKSISSYEECSFSWFPWKRALAKESTTHRTRFYGHDYCHELSNDYWFLIHSFNVLSK